MLLLSEFQLIGTTLAYAISLMFAAMDTLYVLPGLSMLDVGCALGFSGMTMDFVIWFARGEYLKKGG